MTAKFRSATVDDMVFSAEAGKAAMNTTDTNKKSFASSEQVQEI